MTPLEIAVCNASSTVTAIWQEELNSREFSFNVRNCVFGIPLRDFDAGDCLFGIPLRGFDAGDCLFGILLRSFNAGDCLL